MARAALALPFSGLSGALGDTIVVQLPDGPQVRRRNPVRRGQTLAQAAATARMERVSRAWAGLDDATFAAWGAYSRTQAWRNPATGAIVTPKAYSLFVGLASKARQVDPELDLSRFAPPARAFTGDGIVLEVAAPEPPPPAPSSKTSHLEEGVVTFASSGANAPGVLTELLVQPLVNARRAAYRDKYASRGFVAFAGAESVGVPCGVGAWACAVRFVRRDTGQETGLVELGVVTVG